MIDKKTLLTRTLTAVVFAAIVIFLLNFNRTTVFIFLVLVTLTTSYEYIKIKKENKANIFELVLISIIFGVMPLIIEYFSARLTQNSFLVLLILTIIFDIYLIYKLFFIKSFKTKKVVFIYFEILFYIGIPFMLLGHSFLTQEDSLWRVIFLLILLIWTNDTFAYLTGSMLGKNKLMPSISPGKTIEGFVAGGIFTILVSFILFRIYGTFSVSFYIILAIIVWLLGAIGDLIESQLKRTYNIKDSGKIMPGHGGFLDRFDSFVFVVPFLVLLAYFLK